MTETVATKAHCVDVFFKCHKLTDSRREKDSRLVLNQPECMNSITLMLLTL